MRGFAILKQYTFVHVQQTWFDDDDNNNNNNKRMAVIHEAIKQNKIGTKISPIGGLKT